MVAIFHRCFLVRLFTPETESTFRQTANSNLVTRSHQALFSAKSNCDLFVDIRESADAANRQNTVPR